MMPIVLSLSLDCQVLHQVYKKEQIYLAWASKAQRQRHQRAQDRPTKQERNNTANDE